MRRSLNFRLTLIIFSVAIITSAFWMIAIRVFIVRVAELNQQEYVLLLEDFLNKTEDQGELQNLPSDLKNDLVSIQQNVIRRIGLLNSVARWRWLWITSLFIVLAIITYLLAVFLARRLTTPIKSVALASRKLAKGNLEVRVSPDKSNWDNYSLALAHDFNEMASSLEQLQEERQTMIADIAHELRTPVAVMQAQLESLQDGVDPLTPEAIDSLYEETELLSRLIIDLRTLSLAEAQQLSLELSEVDIGDLVKRTIARFEKEADQKAIHLVAHVRGLHRLEVDAERLSQVLSNLLSNSLRFTPEGGCVTVSLEQKESNLVLTVQDTGKGLSEDALKHVFDRFYRSEKGRVRSEGGSGLGLAIVKALVELHGGRVSVRNHSEGGAIFKIFLPNTISGAPTSYIGVHR